MSATGRTKRIDLAKLGLLLADDAPLPEGLERAQDVDGKPIVVQRTARAKGDFYRTPRETIEAILSHLKIPANALILDAGSGDGAIAAVLSEKYPSAEIVGIERDPELVARARERGLFNAEFVRGNWYKYTSELEAPDLVIMNPPFSFAREFVERALAIVKRGGTVCALLRIGFAAGRCRRDFHRRHGADMFLLEVRPSFTGEGCDATEYAWFVWRPGSGGRYEVLPVEKRRRAKKTKAAKANAVPALSRPRRVQRRKTASADSAAPLPEVLESGVDLGLGDAPAALLRDPLVCSVPGSLALPTDMVSVGDVPGANGVPLGAGHDSGIPAGDAPQARCDEAA